MSSPSRSRPSDLLGVLRSVVALLEQRQRLRHHQHVLDLAMAVRLRQGCGSAELERLRITAQSERCDCDARLVVQLDRLHRELGHGGLGDLLNALDGTTPDPLTTAQPRAAADGDANTR